MQFKILITPDRPTQGDLVLAAETPLSGVTFIEEVGKCLRRSIDHIARYRHITLGALAIYEITVPQQLAIDSGLFEDKSTISVIVENDLLSHYIFYGASVDQRSSGRPCYPYMHGEATLVSYIDELQFLCDWAAAGYPTRISWDNGLAANTTQSNINIRPSIGCDGCTCYRGPNTPCTDEHCYHEHHHHHHMPPPPPPPHHHHPHPNHRHWPDDEECWECEHAEWHGSVMKDPHKFHHHQRPCPPPPPPRPLIAYRPDYKIPPTSYTVVRKPKPPIKNTKIIL